MVLTKAQIKNLENIKSGRGFQSNTKWEKNPEYMAALTEVFKEASAPNPLEAAVKAALAKQVKPKAEEKKANPDNDEGATLFCTNPVIGSVNAMIGSLKIAGKPDIRAISEQIKKLATGNDTAEIQTMLAAQAITLQAVFNYQMIRIGDCKTVEQTEVVFSQAIRAQEQCRKTLATLATLAEIKNPKRPSQFIKTYVNKQLNQLRLEQQNSEIFQPNPANELLRESADAAVDIGGTAAATRINPALETVGEIDGPENT